MNFVKGEYSLHPVIRTEALKRLRDSEDWEQANRLAAEFWTESVRIIESIEDAIRAFEAYYHYVENQDFDSACNVLLLERRNKWFNFKASLGKACYRLSLWKQCISAICKVAPYLKQSKSKCYHLSKIYNILGDLYWMTGSIYQAIEVHKESGILANQVKEDFMLSDLNALQASSLFNQGLCNLDLWEIEIALKFFSESKRFSYKKSCTMVLEASMFCSAFLESEFGNKQTALALIWECDRDRYKDASREWASGHKYIFLGLAYKNLKKINHAFQMFEKALVYAEESDYKQVKAKALTGLAELYRIKNQFSKSLSHHHESIQILDRIGAKCDLAEAYYQLALTQQKMGNPESKTHFNKAIELWTEIDAPKQIERICNSMNNPSN